MSPDPLVSIRERLISSAEPPPLVLFRGELVLTQPAAQRLADAVVEAKGGEIQLHVRPTRFDPLLDYLQTFSLFGGGKVMVVVDSGVLADQSVALDWMKEVRAALPLGPGELSNRAREAGVRLFQLLRLFGLNPESGDPVELLNQLPPGVWSKRKLAAKKHQQAIEETAPLIEAARLAGVQGLGDRVVARLGDLVERGLPAGHLLLLAERSVSPKHPLAASLRDAGLVVELGEVRAQRGSWEGVGLLVAELERETGVGIAPDARDELARRILQQEGRGGDVDPASTARFAGEYRKLAGQAQGRIRREMVAESVEDRGEEDVWKILDATAEGRAGDALTRLRRLVASASDPVATRLSFFALLAGFCRQMVAIRAVVGKLDLPPAERNYSRFKGGLAPRLAGDLPISGRNPLSGLHPFRLHRAYLAASRLTSPFLDRLLWRLLETELQLKGESRRPQEALEAFVVEIASQSGKSRASARNGWPG